MECISRLFIPRMAYDYPAYPVFASSSLRQRGSGVGPLVAGVSSVVLPIAKKYALPFAKRVGKEFVRNAIPEIVDVVTGKTKAKAAVKRAAVKTVKKQLGAGGRRVRRYRKKKSVGRITKRKSTKSRRRVTKKKTVRKGKKKSGSSKRRYNNRNIFNNLSGSPF